MLQAGRDLSFTEIVDTRFQHMKLVDVKMLKTTDIPVLTEVIDDKKAASELHPVSADKAEKLAQALETELRPIIKEAIRDAVRDGARRLARDLRKRLDDELGLMIREAVDDALHDELDKR